MRERKRRFKAGVLTAGEWSVSEEGVPPGSCGSPILATILAHHGLDTWCEAGVKAHGRGQVALDRSADDAVMWCQDARDAERMLRALRQRLAKDRRRRHEEKTRLGSCSTQVGRPGEPPGTCELLGCLFSGGRSRKGAVMPTGKTSGQRFRSKLPRGKEWARASKDKERLTTRWPTCCAKRRGHIHYDGVSFHLAHGRRFLHRATRILWQGFNRRRQRRSMHGDPFHRFLQRPPLPRAQIYHALFSPPQRRQRWCLEPIAFIGHEGFCMGGSSGDRLLYQLLSRTWGMISR
jgi:hypothetical protein